MHIDRTAGPTTRARDLAQQVSGLRQGCLGCDDCKGRCHELVEAMLVPDIVLKGK
ncbi:hypothetical protein [Maritimibacter dapengensis]|uniref:Bacterioferritin-associated ferredoxin n=1 Tax=Maritimibacter dapengensis TaxID=2836868 RepID=A0ABS6SZT8_9RHOB|nr:hypothetical protein [Maritimibacter dapengensis]MBV7377642.1 hypothetical protein [Maritimibacter dapengensis]